jgi:hypothetical protein
MFERMHGMRRLTSCAGLASLLMAVVYGPMFHLHTGSEHDGGAFIHAHFPDLPHLETEPGPEIEPNDHDHGAARPVDFLTTNAPGLVHVEFIAVEEPLILAPPQRSMGFAVTDEPRAHAPPVLISSIPRSPPV